MFYNFFILYSIYICRSCGYFVCLLVASLNILLSVSQYPLRNTTTRSFSATMCSMFACMSGNTIKNCLRSVCIFSFLVLPNIPWSYMLWLLKTTSRNDLQRPHLSIKTYGSYGFTNNYLFVSIFFARRLCRKSKRCQLWEYSFVIYYNRDFKKCEIILQLQFLSPMKVGRPEIIDKNPFERKCTLTILKRKLVLYTSINHYDLLCR